MIGIANMTVVLWAVRAALCGLLILGGTACRVGGDDSVEEEHKQSTLRLHVPGTYCPASVVECGLQECQGARI